MYLIIQPLLITKIIFYKKKTHMTKRTYQPKKRKRIRTHGFFARVRDKIGGLKVVKKRRNKQRKELTKTINKRYK